MKTVIIDGVECELVATHCADGLGTQTISYRPLLAKKKTIIEVAAKAANVLQAEYRTSFYVSAAAFDAIEARLQALEEKVK